MGEAATWAKTEYTYDSRGRLTAVIQYEGDSVESVTRYTYDGVGNTLTMTTGLTSLDDTTGSTTTYTYDRFGNLLTTTDALGKTETNTYSTLGKHLSTTDRNGNTTVYTYDALGRVVSAVCGTDTLQYVYTLTGQVRSETRGNVQTLYNYDSQGRVTRVTESPFAYVKAYTYDRADNRTAMTVTRNNTTVQAVTYTYDTLNRLSTVSENGTLQATYTYDTNGNRASLTYANGVVEAYQYNKANWITALTNSKDGQTLSSYAYTYYASGSQKSETDHNNVVTSYTYDDLGRLTQESETGELAVSYAYDANGNRIRMTVGNPPVIITLDPNGGTLPEGTATQITLPVEEGYTLPTPTIPFITFTGWYLDDTEITDENLSQITASCTLTAQWDDELGDIIIGPIDPIFPPTPPPEIMSEPPEEGDDEGENTTSYTVTYTYDANNRLVAEVSDKTGENVLVSYTYDDNGNLLSQLNVDNTAVVTHAYDGFNRLISSVTGAGTITYTYNAQGIRASRTVGVTTTNYLLDGGNVIGEVTGSITTTYLRGINLISGSGKFYLYDAHGDVVQLTDSTGAVTKTYSYDAFGNERDPDEEDTNPFRYCGEYYDTETGLYYLRARYYDPLIGRFTQEDTHWNTVNMIYGDNPQKINEREDALGLKHYSYAPQLLSILQAGNLYAYCTNNPVLFADRRGTLLEIILNIMRSVRDKDREFEFIHSQVTCEYAEDYFGLSNIRKAGCGAVATYNALLQIGRPMDFNSIKWDFVRKWYLAFGGLLGTWPFMIDDYLNDLGVNTTTYYRMDRFEDNLSEGTVFIISFFWSPITEGAHTVMGVYSEGKYMMYNHSGYSAEVEPRNSLDEILEGGSFWMGIIIKE